jgi:ankyrin repeat protein
VNTADKEGNTPFHEATYKGHVEIARELLNHGASLDFADENGNTPLHEAAYKGHVLFPPNFHR